MRLLGTHYWITYRGADDTKHIREIGDEHRTYCNASVREKWFSDNLRLDVPTEQVCPVCYSLYTLELF
jgi:hypothetical protein